MLEVNHENGLLLLEIADGVSVEDIKAATGCVFQVHVHVRGFFADGENSSVQ